MKKYYHFAALIFIVFTACRQKQPAPVQQAPIPQALQQSKSDYPLLTKSRGYGGNLVDDIYNELVEKTPSLDSLEQGIDKVTSAKQDSIKPYNQFNEKNQGYYTEATSYTSRITDSAVKIKVQQLLDNSLAAYKNQTAAHNRLIETISKKDLTLADLHVVLKLVKSMAVMQQYQAQNLPATTPMQAVVAEYDKVITATEKAGGSQ